MHKGIHRALRFGGGVRGVGACICLVRLSNKLKGH